MQTRDEPALGWTLVLRRQPVRLGDRHLVVVNRSGRSAQARIPLDWPDLPGRSWQLSGIFGPSVFGRDGGGLAGPGLLAGRGRWRSGLLAVR